MTGRCGGEGELGRRGGGGVEGGLYPGTGGDNGGGDQSQNYGQMQKSTVMLQINYF